MSRVARSFPTPRRPLWLLALPLLSLALGVVLAGGCQGKIGDVSDRDSDPDSGIAQGGGGGATQPADGGAGDASSTVCGDETCGVEEDCSLCPDDCGACPAACPNGACEAGEDCLSCADDCGACPPTCPNGGCDPGEDCQTCPQDCGACPPSCPNGGCDPGEDCQTCPQDCGACPPAIEARFNMPQGTASPDPTLENTVIDLIDRTPAGQSIRVSMYTFTRSAPAQALVAAQARGVDVQVILDENCVGGNGHSILSSGLPATNLHICHSSGGGSCIGTNINHSKLYLFSYIGPGESQVVVQSSANLTNPQLGEHNNLVIVRGDAALYAGYQTYWLDLLAQVKNPNYYWHVVGNLPVRTYFYPRASGDTIVSVLGNVVCAGNARLRVAMSLFSDARLAIAQLLAQKVAEGCSVKALLKDDGSTPGSGVLSTLLAGGVEVRLFAASAALSSIHSKYLLVDSHYDTGNGPVPRQLVFTGSHNYNGNALHNNDEQLMRVEDASVFSAFWANWQQIRATVP